MPGGISGIGDVFMTRSILLDRRRVAAQNINGCCMAGTLERAMWKGKTLLTGAKENS